MNGFVAVAGPDGRLPRSIPASWGDLPAVVVGTRAPGVSSVAGDDRAAMTELVAHLVDGGVRRPAFVAAPTARRGAPSTADRFLAACRERGLHVDGDRLVPGRSGRLSGYRITAELVRRFPDVDCIVAGDDDTALGVLDALAEAGIDVPGRVRVAGYGDDVRGTHSRPTLTTVDRRPADLGRLGADLLVARMSGDARTREETVVLRLVVRRSTQPPPTHLRPVPDPERWDGGGSDDLLDRAQAAVGPVPDVLDAGWARRWLERLAEQMTEGRVQEAWVRTWGRPVGSVDDIERATDWLAAASRTVHDSVTAYAGTAQRSAATDVLGRVTARLARVVGDRARAAERADVLAARRLVELREAVDRAPDADAALRALAGELDGLGVRRLVAIVPEPPAGGGGRVALAFDEGRVLPPGRVPSDADADADPAGASPVVVRPLVAAGETLGLLAYEPGRSRGRWTSATVPDELVTAVEQALARDRWRVRALEAGSGADERVAEAVAHAVDSAVAEATAQLAEDLRHERERRTRAEEELQRATREMTQSMQVDPLTGIHNRSSLDAALEREWAAHVASRRPLALLMVDVDHFKPYNDRYGHLQGDASLRMVADLLRAAARRAGDLAARYGGEEFAVVLPDTDVQSAEDVAEGILRSVRSAGVPHADAPGGVLTVSVGTAVCLPAAEWAHTDLVRAADGALYRAKAEGRNRSVTTVTVPPVLGSPVMTERALAAPASRRALEGPRH